MTEEEKHSPLTIDYQTSTLYPFDSISYYVLFSFIKTSLVFGQNLKICMWILICYIKN